MKQIEIDGGHILEGTINISGAKNSAVALVPALYYQMMSS